MRSSSIRISTGNRPEKWVGSKGKGKKEEKEGGAESQRDKNDKDQGQWGARDAKEERNVTLELRCSLFLSLSLCVYMCVWEYAFFMILRTIRSSS